MKKIIKRTVKILCCVSILGISVSCGSSTSQQLLRQAQGEQDNLEGNYSPSPEMPDAPDTSAEMSSVIFNDSELTDYEVMLTLEQETFLNNLSANDLPKKAADLSTLRADQIWRDTLVPLAYDEDYDITLYGVVDSDWLSEVQQNDGEIMSTYGMSVPLIVLRYGNQLVTQNCAWYRNVQYLTNPWIAVDDFDNDEKEEVAICTHVTGGTGMSYHELLIYDLEEQEFFSPEISNLDISVEAMWDENRLLLHGGAHTLEIPIDDYDYIEEGSPITYGLIVDYEYDEYGEEGKRLQCKTSLAFGYGGYPYIANVTVPVIFADGQYKLGDVAVMEYLGD